MNQLVNAFYTQKNELYAAELKSVTQKSKRFAWYRFFTFIFIFVPLFVWGVQTWITPAVALPVAVFFFFLIKKNNQLDKRKRRFGVLKKLTEDELLALTHSFAHFPNGKEFLNTDHFFSYDLDLFGDGSLFQFLNRTATQSGKQKLAGWLMNPPFQQNEIRKKQQAVKELSEMPDWRLQFLADGQLFEETEQMNREIRSWSEMELTLKNSTRTQWLINIVPALTLLAIIPAALGISNFFIALMVLLQWTILYFYGKRINEYFKFFGRKSELLEKYMQLLQKVEEEKFQSEYLQELRQKITSPDSASHIFQQLKSRVIEFEFRGNLIVGLILNSFFLWDVRCVYKLWKWHQAHHRELAVWLGVIAETDALISLANFTRNNSGLTFPEIEDEEFTFQATDLGHPLLHPQKRVCNDFSINGWSKVVIITGANMAGKSTFLRTVGVNLVLARMGAPVCAEKLVFTPIDIYTNMRTTDSLLKDESYFFAELKRIKGVLDRLQKGERIFVILDEMLKGTNSVDKLNGSKELIRKLVQLQSVSLIATHDLKLSEMELEFPDKVNNLCFEIRIENDELVFDYKLSDGVTQTMNATFLMKKMGII